MKRRLKIKQGGEAQTPACASYKYLSMKSRVLPSVLDGLHGEELLHPSQEWVNRSIALKQGHTAGWKTCQLLVCAASSWVKGQVSSARCGFRAMAGKSGSWGRREEKE